MHSYGGVKRVINKSNDGIMLSLRPPPQTPGSLTSVFDPH